MPKRRAEEALASSSPSLMQENINKMRIKLTIQRNKLEPVDVLWTISEDSYKSTTHTISRWLSEVDEVIPLESEDWGLEDYVVHIQGFECLHFKNTGHVFRDGDHVTIRPLETADVRSRQMSGRHQINPSGITLVDGVPFGRTAIRAIDRPAIHIPPLKRRRLTYDDLGTTAAGTEESVLLSEIDGSSEQLLLVNSGEAPPERARNTTRPQRKAKEKKSVRFGTLPEDETDEEDDEDFDPEDVDDESLGEDSESESSDDEVSEHSTSSSDDESDSSSEADSDDVEPRRIAKVNGVPKHTEDKSEGRKNSSASATKSNKEPTSRKRRSTDDEEFANDEREEFSTSAYVPPGQGLDKTRKRNQRRRIKSKIDILVSTGQLPTGSTKQDLMQLLSRAESSSEPTLSQGGVLSSVSVVDEVESGGTSHKKLIQHPQVVVNGEDAQNEADFTKRREKLLALLDQASEVPEENPQELATGEEDFEVTLEKKRPPRDLETVKRMIYGSLGVRTPKTKEDEEKTRQKLMSMKGPVKQIPNGAEDVEGADIRFEEVSAAWKTKIILSAVECCEEGVVLSTPPFPFVQRWDPQQQRTQTPGKQQGKKRKRKGREDYGHGGEGEEAFDEYYEGDQETTVLDYDNETDVNASSMLQGQVESQIMNDIATANDLPMLPSSLQNLKDATLTDMAPGVIIAYKVLEVSESTGWAPAISSYKTAEVMEDNELSDSTFKVVLAPRDRTQAKYDENGNRVFEKFDMIVEDDEQDDGIRILNFAELYEPKVVRAVQVENAMASDKVVEADSDRYASDDASVHEEKPDTHENDTIDEMEAITRQHNAATALAPAAVVA